MAKRPSLSASFVVGEQPILDPTHQPKLQAQPQSLGTPTPKARDHRENRQAFTVWLDRDLIAQVRGLSRELVMERGRAGNSIEALVTEAMRAILAKHGR
ncbi:hypothetical protein Q8W71_27180 [Methylobacterium sp. NEAU 140]|uniref:hypothetical protein n=1 Tax=Methylobacterium sp. NEAU 140 TaxID=3064945 RepID=UPI002735C341|nr:hypothetical protein [Methylobacterium sp. NEAU 140]MDP4026311.1 hypothetical protein [Methylobacterium sp. NEAU 140]